VPFKWVNLRRYRMVGSHEPIAVGGGGMKDPIVHFEVLLEAGGLCASRMQLTRSALGSA
jgi:hypothetical protein